MFFAARSNSSAPAVSMSSVSWPSGTLMAASCRQPTTGSPHASTRKCQSPAEVTMTRAPRRSVPGASSRMATGGSRWPSGRRSTTPAPSSSCPSRNTVALTSNASPQTALAGYAPHSTTGCTSRIGMRPITLPRYPSEGECKRPGYRQAPARIKVALRESDPPVHHPPGPARAARAAARADAESALVMASRHTRAFCRYRCGRLAADRAGPGRPAGRGAAGAAGEPRARPAVPAQARRCH